MIDFTTEIYCTLLDKLQQVGYRFMTMTMTDSQESEAKKQESRLIILRHDVERYPERALRVAEMEYEKGIRATYYFRAVRESWDEDVIRKIAALGHEVGYHYESLTTANGDVDVAYKDFCENLERLRALVPVTSICMHGAPRSPYDSKDIWKKYSYRELGIVAEPYLDTDFSQWFYLTDTGRRWDGYQVSVRDRIPQYQEVWEKAGLTFHTTQDIIRRVNELPARIMITTHPQRWNNFGWAWIQELMMQGIKNIVKRGLILVRNR